MLRRRRYRHGQEEGLFLILTAVAATALFGMVAIVLDLSALRQDRAENRLVADAAVTAAASRLGANDGPGACTTAWEYFLANVNDEGTISQSPACSSFPVVCSATTSATRTTGIAGQYVVEISYPVPDTDPLMEPDSIGNSTQTVVAEDGDRCSRIGVHITRERTLLFAGVFGLDSQRTSSHSVGLHTLDPGTAGALPALVTFEQHDCLSVNANTGEIRVENFMQYPGLIFTDSDGTGLDCSGPGTPTPFVIDARGSGRIRAFNGSGGEQAVIGYVATNGRGYDPGDIPPSLRVAPAPTFQSERLTRIHVDRVHNCSNSAYTPSLCEVDPVTGVVQQDPIAQLQIAYRGVSAPPGFGVYNGTCQPGPLDFSATPNWFIDCNDGPTFVVKNGLIKFGAGTVVFKSGVSVEAGGQLQVGSASADSIIFLRDGGLRSVNNQPNTFTRTFLYSDAASAPPLFMGHTSTSTFTWTPPTASQYKKLLFWTESTGNIEFSGGPPLNMVGVLMAAQSKFIASGGGTVDATEVQFLVRSATTIGTSRLLLRPDPNTAQEFPKAGVRLIR